MTDTTCVHCKNSIRDEQSILCEACFTGGQERAKRGKRHVVTKRGFVYELETNAPEKNSRSKTAVTQ